MSRGPTCRTSSPRSTAGCDRAACWSPRWARRIRRTRSSTTGWAPRCSSATTGRRRTARSSGAPGSNRGGRRRGGARGPPRCPLPVGHRAQARGPDPRCLTVRADHPGPVVATLPPRHPRRRSSPRPAPSTRTRRAASSSATGRPRPAAGRSASCRRATRRPRRCATRSTRAAAPADDRDRRRGRGLLGHRPLAHAHTGRAVPDRHRSGDIYRDPLYVLVSLSDDEADAATGEPGVRAWRILDGEVAEVVLR